MISQDDIARIQQELGRLALDAVRIDLEGFLEATGAAASPQALAAGLGPNAVTSAGRWEEMARLLKPFRDDAIARLESIWAQVAEDGDEFVSPSQACPRCRERRVDELTLNEDGSVVCATCGNRYSITGKEEAEDA